MAPTIRDHFRVGLANESHWIDKCWYELLTSDLHQYVWVDY